MGVQVKERAAKARPQVKQVKILRDAEKADLEGKAASKGLGFVELTEHEHALCALRQLNNNPVPFGACSLPRYFDPLRTAMSCYFLFVSCWGKTF